MRLNTCARVNAAWLTWTRSINCDIVCRTFHERRCRNSMQVSGANGSVMFLRLQFLPAITQIKVPSCSNWTTLTLPFLPFPLHAYYYQSRHLGKALSDFGMLCPWRHLEDVIICKRSPSWALMGASGVKRPRKRLKKGFVLSFVYFNLHYRTYPLTKTKNCF